jgi:hypothetical protein
VVAAAVLAADCYERTLTSRRIRQAYFLGKCDAAKRAEFLRQYFRSFPLPRELRCSAHGLLPVGPSGLPVVGRRKPLG